MKNVFKLVVLFLFSFACSRPFAQTTMVNSLVRFDAQPVDYSLITNWAAHPWKKDMSDSVPAPLKKDYHPDSSADIFFIHPTSYTSPEKQYGWNAPIDDSTINKKTDDGSILYQASIFNAAGRVFAPRYRQAHISAYFTSDTATALAAFDLAYQDVKSAFEYYLEHYNNGRPIIIAAHSQGTTHAKRLLKEFFDGTPLQHQLVVAYLVGMAVEPDCFSNIPVCDTATQTGCVCSWRTFREDYEPLWVQEEKFKAIVTNPLTWNIHQPDAARDANKGAVLLKFNKVLPGTVNAEVHDGVLWVEKPHFFGNVFYTTKNYHIGDYNLFYVDVRENAEARLQHFLKN